MVQKEAQTMFNVRQNGEGAWIRHRWGGLFFLFVFRESGNNVRLITEVGTVLERAFLA